MAQQVYECRIGLQSLSTLVDNASFSIIIEQQGTQTNLVNSTVISKVVNFINTTTGGAVHAPGAYFHGVFSRAANTASLELYDITAHLDGSPHGSPVSISYFTLPTAYGAWFVPEGCSMQVGYRSDYGTDVEFAPGARPRSRDRGRMYLPAMCSTAVTNEAATNRTIWTPAALTDIGDALVGLNTSGGTTDVPTWVQWSRTNKSVKNITHIWIEDAPRYQRRRVDSGSDHVVV